MKPRGAPLSIGFPPVADSRARVLVLGSLPGRRSLQMREYYAQPQNAFWKIMGALFGAEPSLPYDTRMKRLRANGVALWDVLAAGERHGSLDAAIVPSSIVVNDFDAFFASHPQIRLICFNGNTAAALYRRKVRPHLHADAAALQARVLPSTSPAYASLRLEHKLAAWTAALQSLEQPSFRSP